MSTATAILGSLALSSTGAVRYTQPQRSQDTHRCTPDVPPPSTRRTPAPGTVTLSADQYAYLISLIHVQPAPAPSLARAQPSPSRVPPSAPLSQQARTLIEQFPHVEPDLLLAIARHTLDPLDLYKLDEHYRGAAGTPPPAELADPLSAPITVTTREFITRYYPSFSALVSPLSTYFRILLALASSAPSPPPSPASPHAPPPPRSGMPARADVLAIASASTQYLARLVALSEEHHWAVILPYHMAFHRARMEEMRRGDYSGWDKVDIELLVRLIEECEREQDGARSR
ncbi:hypothetical protein DAEQUDRAFT_739043 [Daedalea quercina L-15889]|uniref:Uncharacterized protein n=1 Tax=Daedalea quercina L-15889 TaxID=1314783 RepID=A0A165PA78_9APHY|nr:hypothetical protein DAEQUDRAFT_739043 [Daedalea quercina L-15889]